MLKPIQNRKALGAGKVQFAIVASQYNAQYVDSMLLAAKKVLKSAGAKRLQVIRVPGAFEIPLVASRLALRKSPPFIILDPASARDRVPLVIICLGVIVRGETVHAAQIGEAVSRALMEIQIKTGVPVIHEVLLLENEEQAKVRCLGRKHNRGAEAAQTALAMVRVLKQLEI